MGWSGSGQCTSLNQSARPFAQKSHAPAHARPGAVGQASRHTFPISDLKSHRLRESSGWRAEQRNGRTRSVTFQLFEGASEQDKWCLVLGWTLNAKGVRERVWVVLELKRH